jgi:hypothetical protein
MAISKFKIAYISRLDRQMNPHVKGSDQHRWGSRPKNTNESGAGYDSRVMSTASKRKPQYVPVFERHSPRPT